jgi:hypothetical protein
MTTKGITSRTDTTTATATERRMADARVISVQVLEPLAWISVKSILFLMS